MKRLGSWLLRLLLMLFALALLIGLLGTWWLRGSLPQLDGERLVRGTEGPITLLRDAQGLLTVQAERRADIAFGLGFAHAQDRFFQMDLQRRNAAGELSALFGERALGLDRQHRIHRFRSRAERNFAAAPAQTRTLLERYAQGVNAGLAALDRPSFEYTVLQLEPEPWVAEDAYLTLFSMTLVLQDDQARFERGLGLMRDVLPPDLYAFFSQQGGRWDAPLEGESFSELPVPDTGWAGLLPQSASTLDRHDPYEEMLLPGSNNWAVSGDLTEHGGALVADDMHLGLRVPNIWYRAAWVNPDSQRLVSGVTLPGTPFLVAGSNGQVAWGFTNTQGDWSDVIPLVLDESGTRYETPTGWEALVTTDETIMINEGDPATEAVRETRWGPIIGNDHQGRPLALRWAAHDPEGANFTLIAMESVDTVFDALPLAPGFGIPHQNLVMGDAQGNIAWTIAGPVPRRIGADGMVPRPWSAEPGRQWDGYLGPEEQPRVVNPPSGRLWTANARVVSGEKLRLMGMSGPALGARQQQIRDRLLDLDSASEADMLAIQLDDEARFLAPWRDRLLALLTPELTGSDPAFAEARTFLEDWSGRASHEDVGYRIVRQWRLAVLDRITAPLAMLLTSKDETFRLRAVSRQFEVPAWTLLEARPAHLLNPEFDSWSALEQAALSAVLEPWFADGTLANDRWGARNTLAISHPLAGALPFVGRWLRMPAEPVDGDTHMPRVQAPGFGASERFAVSPGREDQAYLHMATGQSAHPLSDFFDAGHQDWVQGRPSPWLAGETRHTLWLLPERTP